MESQEENSHLYAGAVVFEAAIGGVALGLGAVFGFWPLDRFAWDLAGLGWGALATVPMMIFFVIFWVWPVGPFLQIRESVREMLGVLFKGRSAAEIALASIAAGFGEELLFRGLLQGGLEEPLGVWPAILIGSALFGLAHPISKLYVVLAAVIGVFLGWLYVETDNLLAPMTAHALYDFVALLILVRSKR